MSKKKRKTREKLKTEFLNVLRHLKADDALLNIINLWDETIAEENIIEWLKAWREQDISLTKLPI